MSKSLSCSFLKYRFEQLLGEGRAQRLASEFARGQGLPQQQVLCKVASRAVKVEGWLSRKRLANNGDYSILQGVCVCALCPPLACFLLPGSELNARLLAHSPEHLGGGSSPQSPCTCDFMPT